MKILSDQIQLSATDLSNHLGCDHLTELNRLYALGRIAGPSWMDPALNVLAKRGDDHEAAYVRVLQSRGLSVESLRGKTMNDTVEAMRRGVDVIVQAALVEEGLHDGKLRWLGYADILYKVNAPSDLGDWSYEVQDTKLSRNTRAATILQLSLYTEVVGQLQGRQPEYMHVVKPGTEGGVAEFEIETFRFDSFKAYYRLAKQALEQTALGNPRSTYPEPVEHCGVCRWWKDCDKKRHDDDHLSLIANIRSMHVGELYKHQIQTLEQFAKRDVPIPGKPDRGSMDTFWKVHSQAKIQLKGRVENKLVHELLPTEPGRGFFRLPEPCKGDIYFDIEGDPFFDQSGLEYLLGFVYRDEGGALVYDKYWAHDRAAEKKAFDRFMTFVMDRLKRYPELHIYHFAPYEPSAIKRLSLRHTLHEENLDWLLRAERFVDLHAVAREGLRASVERYSLKDLERFTSYVRNVDLSIAGSARRAVEFSLELKSPGEIAEETLSLVEGYNADDCFATHALHEWLEQRRAELVLTGADVPRPALKTGEASEPVSQLDARTRLLFGDLTKNLPDDPGKWSEQEKARWLFANQLDYFRRELKSAYWEYYYLHELSFEDALDERKAIAGLSFIGDAPIGPRGRVPIHKYSFPPQEIGLKEGSLVFEIMGEQVGTIESIDHEACVVHIKKMEKSRNVHPRCIHEKDVVDIKELANSLANIALSIVDDGFDDMAYRAAKDLLIKRRPRLGTSPEGGLIREGEDIVAGAVRVALEMRSTVLGIQGPPGSGKTYTGAMVILALLQHGKRIGVTAPSHKVVLNLFQKVLELAGEKGIQVSILHKAKDGEELPPGIGKAKDNKHAINALNEGKVVGGTAWLWAHGDARESLDYLIVDEAGQMSLAHVLAASASARNVILLGDPQQLEQPQKASHPEGADIAALAHLLDGHTTMPDDKGIFLSVTRRLHPAIAAFTSELFYEGRLKSLDGLDVQGIISKEPITGAGLYFVPVQHQGNQNRSQEEVDSIGRVVTSLLAGNAAWRNAKNEISPLTKEDILIVAPYNAQVAALSERLPGMRIGTVDKFQGQEAAVVVYSMTSSSHHDAPRGMNFLYNPNRLNVATSRALCVAILVASEKLLQAECRTVEQMRWANALCRYKEMAKEVRY